MMGGIAALIGLFTGQYAKWMWGLLAVLAVVGVIAAGVMTFENTKKENALLKVQNSQLQQTVVEDKHKIDLLVQEQQLYADRVAQISDQVTVLQDKLAQHYVQKQRTIDNIVTKPGTPATLDQVAAKANTGMNALFHELSQTSQGVQNAKSK